MHPADAATRGILFLKKTFSQKKHKKAPLLESFYDKVEHLTVRSSVPPPDLQNNKAFLKCEMIQRDRNLILLKCGERRLLR